MSSGTRGNTSMRFKDLQFSFELDPLSDEEFTALARQADAGVKEALTQGDRDEAARRIEQRLGQGDRSLFNLITLGEIYACQGRFEDAESMLCEALSGCGGTATCWKHLGSCLLEMNRPEDAFRALLQAWRIADDIEPVRPMLLACLDMQGRLDEAAAVFHGFIAQKENATAEDWREVGAFYNEAGKLDDAVECFERSIEIEPIPKCLLQFAGLLRKRGEISQAIELCEQAEQLAPDWEPVYSYLGSAWIVAQEVEKGLAIMEKGIEVAPNDEKREAAEGACFFYRHYRPSLTRKEFYDAAIEYGQRNFNIANMRREHANRPEPNRRLRIGYISPDFRMHSVSYFFESVLDGCNPQAVENIGYMTSRNEDQVTRRLESKLDRLEHVANLSVAELNAKILADEVDILVDLAGHTSNNRQKVLALKPAPVQATWCGYPDTTGNPGIDYRITDSLADPPETEQWHSEELAYMPDAFLCYRPPQHAPVTKPAPCLANGYITFGSFNNAMKMTPLVRGLWAQILLALPDARLLLKFSGGTDPLVREAIYGDFEKVGIGRDRVEILGQIGNPIEHLDAYNRVDIALDSYPYNGTTTTCEALWMGVPVLSLCGDVHCSRVGYSLLSSCGMDFFVAHNPEEYIHKAIVLANDTDAIQRIHKTMRQRLAASPLCNAPRFAHNLELLYRSMWYEWCSKQGVEIPEDTPAELTRGNSPQIEVVSADEEEAPADKPVLRLIHNLARTGGTLLCKCIGTMQNVALLSEIHPQGVSQFNPLDQACAWHGLLTQDDIRSFHEDGRTMSFPEAIDFINRRANEAGTSLVVRDWAHLDFLAVPFLPIPSNRLGIRDALAGRFDLRSVCLVRHPLDSYLSLRKLSIMDTRLDPDVHLRGARRFAEAASEIGFIRYEDFCASPDETLQDACRRLDIGFDATYKDHWFEYTKISGDTGNSRGSVRRDIKPMPRAAFEPELLDVFRDNEDYHVILDLLGYADAEAPAAPQKASA